MIGSTNACTVAESVVTVLQLPNTALTTVRVAVSLTVTVWVYTPVVFIVTVCTAPPL